MASAMFETLKQRYLMNFVRADQLERYVALGRITQEELEEILASKES